ncbi:MULTISPECIES: type II 3-dehydroquinate dehydratase [unclassified Undibacterium]|uniref:type II 3-dehydroquinate dehydratase n=1 Tax=unclassified Undibacterium TaxID=2630295 RepID=UPI002AC90AD1|nr:MULTISPECIES: type II 3-dehydroquinate dehydratase [unclassified Undibacterium]MEB0138438.1 type II 3-dehydroquinate dehydratase [Undibacterium sp. CCC2.1]MEB0171313.1 type II 3-dehydroquinate dehydratase [Undibacterium sp. CCC1.1]MEB0176450.1 type II 3-dehydroquinate dehydratase [Undibacterium sp. CCC3.4]MEB0214067.1 type II 3-dehydroquinate dehydratase [Undibacterium sp. 5I2]WPX43679.1 type II 3-dehydroquinate dehydratase [Undibacterium sp. CCC3.4]
MMKTLLILNGPNLNLLGTREPGVYGAQTLAEVGQSCAAACAAQGWACDFRQSNHEGVLLDWIQEAGAEQAAGRVVGVIFNAGAYTHSSIALADAVKGAALRLIELHISNVHAREAFRQHSYLSPVAAGVLFGFGTAGYVLAVAAMAELLRSQGQT